MRKLDRGDRQPEALHGLPKMPASVIDSNGNRVSLATERWTTFRNPEKRGVVVFNWDYLLRPRDFTHKGSDGLYVRRTSTLSTDLAYLMMCFTAARLKSNAPIGARNMLDGFIYFEKYLATVYRWGARHKGQLTAENIDAELLASFAHSIHESAPFNIGYISFLRSFYAYWLDRGIIGFDRRTYNKMLEVKTKSPPKAAIARFRDPIKGAFVWEEERQIKSAIERGCGNPFDLGLVQLFDETGIRLAAAIRLRRSNLRESPNPAEWFLDVPRVKQRRATNETRERVISATLARRLLALLPHGSKDDEFLLHWLSNQRIDGDISEAMERWSRAANLVTLRIKPGEHSPLPLSPYRFRRTLATNLADAGCAPETIAEMLDDETIGMALIYVNASSNMVETLAETLDQHPAWFRLIHLFLGKLETSSDLGLPEILGGVPYLAGFSEIAKKSLVIGRCASVAPCTLLPPLSCYTCTNFRADSNLDRHNAQLAQIKLEIDSKIGVEADRMAQIFKDQVFAILTVMSIIKEREGAASSRNDRRSRISRAISQRRPDRG